jgi:hypothetical protein
MTSDLKLRYLTRFVFVFLAGCAGAPSAAPTAATGTTEAAPPVTPPSGSAPTESADSYPAELLAGPGAGQPGLYLGPEPDAPAIGYISEGVALEVAGAPQNGRIPVRIRGGMRVRGWFPVERLAARVLRRGRIQGTAGYVGPNDIVRVLGPADATTMRVSASVPLREGGPEGPSFTGTFPTIGLGAREVAVSPESDVPGTPHGPPPGASLAVYDEPGGTLVYTVPPMTPPALVRLAATRDGYSAVLVGAGPYLAGYTQTTLTPSTPSAAPTTSRPATGAGAMPRRLQEEASLPLHRLPAGTRVRFNGVTIAALDAAGFAREMARHDTTQEIDVFVAVDDEVAVRGMISADDLPGAAAAQPPTIPAP